MTSATPQRLVRPFVQLFSSTRHGARLARLLAAEQLRTWSVPPDVAERAELVTAELAANAVLHGCADGRDFRLALRLDPVARALRVEVGDTRGDRLPALPPVPAVPGDESGRGLLIVAAVSTRWGVDLTTGLRKTVWAELALVRE
jgi:anti-sigma regulatory factor (Ser/Thr protein kinase)